MPPADEPIEELRAIAAALKASRQAAGLSQDALSHRCGLATSEISRLERGVRNPRLSTIVRLARGLGVRPADLLADIG